MQKLSKCKINKCQIFKNFNYNKKLLLTLHIKARTSSLTPALEDTYFDIRTHIKKLCCTIPAHVSALFIVLQFM